MRKQLIKDLQNKYVFFDFDGTLCEHRYNSLAYPIDYNWLKSMLFDSEVYKNVRPLKTMQEVISKLNPDRVFVLGVITTNKEIEQKFAWLEKHFPQIKKENIYFVNKMKNKVETLKIFAETISPQDIVMVDDMHAVLQEAEQEGFTVHHPTSFVD